MKNQDRSCVCSHDCIYAVIHGQDMTVTIRDAARNFIGSRMPAKSLELQHTIRLIRELDTEIAEMEAEIETQRREKVELCAVTFQRSFDCFTATEDRSVSE